MYLEKNTNELKKKKKGIETSILSSIHFYQPCFLKLSCS